MHRNIILSLFFVLFLMSCSSLSKIYVLHIKNLKNLDNSTFIYALPRTVLKISVSINKTTFIPGPYHAYAEKYLGIADADHEQYESWAIENITIESYTEPDPAFYYSLKAPQGLDGLEKDILLFEDKELILTPSTILVNKPLNLNRKIINNKINFTDLSVKRNLISEKETTYKRVLHDSTYIQVPVVNEQLKPKSTELKAEEAANFIIKIRKRKFKLLTGQTDTNIAEENLEVSIAELNRIENEYLSLFIGKTTEEKLQKSLDYLPDASRENDQVILFKIYEKQGIFDASSPEGIPVIFEIKSLNTAESLDKFQLKENASEIENCILYRIPEIAHVLLKQKDEILLEGKMGIFQYGPLVKSAIVRR